MTLFVAEMNPKTPVLNPLVLQIFFVRAWTPIFILFWENLTCKVELYSFISLVHKLKQDVRETSVFLQLYTRQTTRHIIVSTQNLFICHALLTSVVSMPTVLYTSLGKSRGIECWNDTRWHPVLIDTRWRTMFKTCFFYYFQSANAHYRWCHFQSVKQQRPLVV